MKVTLCVPLLGMLRFGMYSGWANTSPSTLSAKSLPKLLLTLDGVNVVSLGFSPARVRSYLKVRTEAAEAPPGAGAKVVATEASALTVTLQLPFPEHAPLQPEKIEPSAAVAVRVTVVPTAKEALQVFPQLMPAGLLEIVPLPLFMTRRRYG